MANNRRDEFGDRRIQVQTLCSDQQPLVRQSIETLDYGALTCATYRPIVLSVDRFPAVRPIVPILPREDVKYRVLSTSPVSPVGLSSASRVA